MEIEIYLVANTDEDEHEQLWWSNYQGWVSIDDADVYTPDEHDTLRLPMGGKWVRFTGTI